MIQPDNEIGAIERVWKAFRGMKSYETVMNSRLLNVESILIAVWSWVLLTITALLHDPETSADFELNYDQQLSPQLSVSRARASQQQEGIQ